LIFTASSFCQPPPLLLKIKTNGMKVAVLQKIGDTSVDKVPAPVIGQPDTYVQNLV
jgi:hypothetical protein